MTRDGVQVLRIVHVSDLHLEPEATEQYPGLASRLERSRAAILRLEPDFVVATGDLTNRGSVSPADFTLAKSWLDRLDVPYLTVPGNHDLGANRLRGRLHPMEAYEDVEFAETGYAQTFGTEPIRSMDLHGLQIVGIALREDDPDDALGQLRLWLREAIGPVVVVGHYPVVVPRAWSSDEAFAAMGYVDRSAVALTRVIDDNPQVIAYLCGHVHLTSLRRINSRCLQFTAGGLGPGASSFRVYDWDGATWRYSTVDTEGPRIFWETGIEEARKDPLFSSGTDAERQGSWTPDVTPTTGTKEQA
ncbi:metallophosphoesterase family protein [Tessaracoccus defluvii]|uniref:Metallophosphoesterase n=1 Tax=Tessaracoccus defluvii TaxID=1285901 RepID=A0A7H0H400_9ACTN|nr:metallophosphoesterase [Tessaracoccus defluvii]QNP55266.1 metallophosphoesterase [Tessaracoccus defluvii]